MILGLRAPASNGEEPIQSQASSIQATPARSQAGGGAIAIVMYCILLVAYALMAADRYLFPVLAPDVRREFGFSLANTGLLSTIFTLGLGIGGVPTGYLLSHYSRKAVLLAGIVVFSAGTAATTIVGGFWGMLFSLAVTGIGMAMLATSMFALAASYFARNRSAAIGSVNFCYGLGAISGPIVIATLLSAYHSWRVPMLAFAGFGFVMVAVILATVRSWFTETRAAASARSDDKGASRIANRNTVLLTTLSALFGLSLYGYLGMYPTFLRESLHYAPRTAGLVVSFFGLGALGSVAGGWLGDRFSPKTVLTTAFFLTAVLGYLFFHGSPAFAFQAVLSGLMGLIGSAVIYVNLAGYHVKAVRSTLASKGSGMFVTSLYGSAAFAGYLMGGLASYAGWLAAGEIQISLFCILGGLLSLALRPSEMAL